MLLSPSTAPALQKMGKSSREVVRRRTRSGHLFLLLVAALVVLAAINLTQIPTTTAMANPATTPPSVPSHDCDAPTRRRILPTLPWPPRQSPATDQHLLCGCRPITTTSAPLAADHHSLSPSASSSTQIALRLPDHHLSRRRRQPMSNWEKLQAKLMSIFGFSGGIIGRLRQDRQKTKTTPTPPLELPPPPQSSSSDQLTTTMTTREPPPPPDHAYSMVSFEVGMQGFVPGVEISINDFLSLLAASQYKDLIQRPARTLLFALLASLLGVLWEQLCAAFLLPLLVRRRLVAVAAAAPTGSRSSPAAAQPSDGRRWEGKARAAAEKMGLFLLSVFMSGTWVSVLFLAVTTADPETGFFMRLKIPFPAHFGFRVLIAMADLLESMFVFIEKTISDRVQRQATPPSPPAQRLY